MKKIISLAIFFVIFVTALLILGKTNSIRADWWERVDRPAAPTIERDRIPTAVPLPTQVITQTPTQPTPTPRNGGLPTSTPTPGGGGGGTSDDPCAAGKSYTGPYCGWSPSVSEEGDSGEETTARIGGPEVEGLSYTGGSELVLSDIILLTGVLCLLLYARSKLSIRRIP